MSRTALPRIGLLALIWGSAFLWIKLADRGFSPVEVTLARLALGAAVLFAVMLARREKVPRSLRLWASVIIAALFANAAPYLLFAVAEQTVDSSTAGIINATTPLWTVILALAVRHQKSLTRWQAAGLIVGFAGAVLIFSPWHTASAVFSAGGLECLAASVSYAISYVYMDRFLARRGVGATVLSACQLAAAAVMLAIALGISGVQTPHVTAESIAALAILGIAGNRIRLRAELPDHRQRGRDRGIDSDLSPAGGRDRARCPGPQRDRHSDHARRHSASPSRNSPDTPPNEASQQSAAGHGGAELVP